MNKTKTITRDGRVYRRTKGYTWRYGNPEKDVNIHGKPIQSNYVIITNEGSEEMAFPHSHGLTNKVFGPLQRDKNDEEFRYIFWVEDGWIYRTTLYPGE